MTPIKPVAKTATVDFGKEPVNEFWVEAPAQNGNAPQIPNYLERVKAYLDSAPANSVICVFSEELSSKQLCESIAKAYDNGCRIYLLTDTYHGEMKNLDGCLMRYGGGEKTGSFILVNPNADGIAPTGCIFTSMLADGSMNMADNLLLDLDSEQVKILYRYFCYQFWCKAEKERIGREERNTQAAPIDIFPPVEDSCDFGHLKSIWGKETEGALITTSLLNKNSYLGVSNFSNSTILSILPGIDDNIVRSLKHRNNEIHACNETALVNTIKTPDGVWLVPKIDAARKEEVYSIRLNDEQMRILDKHSVSLLNGKTLYHYTASETRENLSGKTVLPLGANVSQKYEIKPESSVAVRTEMQQELLPRDEFENKKPTLDDDGISVSRTYNWTNIPFTLPSGSKEHPLYKNWDDTEKSIVAFIEAIYGKMLEIEKNGNTFSKLIDRLFLGIQQKFSEYRNELASLQGEKFCTIEKTEELQKKIARINEICGLVEEGSGKAVEEYRKAKLTKQIEAKEKEKADLENTLKERKAFLEEAVKKAGELSERQKKLEAQSSEKRTEIKGAKERLEKKKAAKDRILDEITSLKGQEEQPKGVLQEKENALKAIENESRVISSKLEDLEKQAEETAELLKDVTNAMEDKSVERSRVQGEISKLNGKNGNLANEIKGLNDQLKRPPKEPQKQRSVLENMKAGGKPQNRQAATGNLPIPSLPHVPRVGKLHHHNGKDYLAIENWEEYDDGKREAHRLGAKLCATGGNNG